MHPNIKEILISEEEIEKRSQELAEDINEHYKDVEEPLILVALLKGSVPFLASLSKHITLDIEFDFMDVSSYEGTSTTRRDIRILKDLDRSISNVNILLVEDIVDTGHTVQAITKLLVDKGAKDVKVVSLLDKPSRREVDAYADFIGFEIPNEFVIGFGLDFDEKYRQLPYVGILKDEVYQ